ncbi:MAG: hypothetical protein Q9182_003816 [Xanthomendoza sp. 2 TL-2023]
MASDDSDHMVAPRDPFRNLPRRTFSAEKEVPCGIWRHIEVLGPEDPLDYRLDLILSSYTSPFNFSGRYYIKYHRLEGGADTSQNDGSGLRIQGTGNIINGGGVEMFDMIFNVESDTSTGVCKSIGGSGWTSVVFPSHPSETSEGLGKLVFDDIEGMEDQDDVDQDNVDQEDDVDLVEMLSGKRARVGYHRDLRASRQ